MLKLFNNCLHNCIHGLPLSMTASFLAGEMSHEGTRLLEESEETLKEIKNCRTWLEYENKPGLQRSHTLTRTLLLYVVILYAYCSVGCSVKASLITQVKPGKSVSSCCSALVYTCLLEESSVFQEQFTLPLPCLSRTSSCTVSLSMVTSLLSEPITPFCSYSDLFLQSFDSPDCPPLCLDLLGPPLLQWPSLPLVLLKDSSWSSSFIAAFLGFRSYSPLLSHKHSLGTSFRHLSSHLLPSHDLYLTFPES